MTANEIPRTISQFVEKDNPYQCILIDGPWGIGKSFQINKALKDIPYSTTVSLFGAKSVDEVLLKLTVQICDNSKTNTEYERKIKKLPCVHCLNYQRCWEKRMLVLFLLLVN